MPYNFAYAVKDQYNGNDFSHSEDSDGKNVMGTYSVQLPDGRKQTVSTPYQTYSNLILGFDILFYLSAFSEQWTGIFVIAHISKAMNLPLIIFSTGHTQLTDMSPKTLTLILIFLNTALKQTSFSPNHPFHLFKNLYYHYRKYVPQESNRYFHPNPFHPFRAGELHGRPFQGLPG